MKKSLNFDLDTNKVAKINKYENRIKFDDILSNENIDSEKFNSFIYGQGCPVIDNIIYVSIIDFERFCYIYNLYIEYIEK